MIEPIESAEEREAEAERVLCRAEQLRHPVLDVSSHLCHGVTIGQFEPELKVARSDESAVADEPSLVDQGEVRKYGTYVPNKTISVPDDVVPIIDSLDVPFSKWVTEQLRRHAAQSSASFADQLLADAAIAAGEPRPTRKDARAIGSRMKRSAPW